MSALPILVVLLSVVPHAPEGAPMKNAFFAMDTCTKAHYPTSDVLSPDAQLDLLKELGYAGIAWTAGDPAQTKAVAEGCRKRGLRLFAHYLGATLRRDKLEFVAHWHEEIDALSGSGALIWVHIGSQDYADGFPRGESTAVAGLREIAAYAAARGLRVALYPHVGDWIQHVQDCIRLAETVRCRNVGITFNLCHCLKVGDEARIPELLRYASRHLFMVTVNGADTDAATGGWDRLIQTLDRGTYDVGFLLRKLREVHYAGPIGLQGYGIQGDTRANLQRSMEGWRRLAE